MARLSREELGDMDAEGERVKARRVRLGMEKLELAHAAGIHRNTLTALENGESYNRSTLLKVERALEAAEDEAGIGAPPQVEERAEGDPRTVVVKIGEGPGAIVVEGPVEDLERLEASAMRLMRAMGQIDDPPK